MSPTTPNDPWSRRRSAGTRQISVCQPRLALSASPGADVLMEMLGVAGANPGNTLWQQADDLHSQHGLTGDGQTIAVIDSGIAYDHVALGGGFGPGYRVVGGWDFAENDANPYDDGPSGFHGTHVSGILAGNMSNFQGLAPEADLVALRVFNDQGEANFDWIEDALQWVHDNRNRFENPITTVNLSIGALIPEQLVPQIRAQLADELSQLRNDGILVFAAAGNQFNANTPTQLTYPASSPDVIAVGSVSPEGTLSSFSQRADNIFAAPGQNVVSTVPENVLGWDGQFNDLTGASGTSMASPQVAAASVLVREALQERGMDASPASILETLRSSADLVHDPISGADVYRLNLQRAISGLPPLDDAGAEPALDLIDLSTIKHTDVVDFDRNQWYEIEPTRSGTLSLVATNDGSFLSGTERASLVALDHAGTEIFRGSLASLSQVDLPVTEGQTIRLRLTGDSSVSAHVVNAVSLANGKLDVTGSNYDDTVKLDLANGVALHVNGAEYKFRSADVRSIDMDLGLGNDRFEATGSANAEKVTLMPGSGEIEQTARMIKIASAESMSVAGGGGADRGYIYDAASDDQLELNPGSAKFTGPGFQEQLTGFGRIYAFATAGGEDRAVIVDSAQDDLLVIRPQFTSLRSDNFYVSANGFERVQAYASTGGFDKAELYDSAGDDRMSASAVQAWISGPGYFAQARNFEEVRGFATAGGQDYATLYAGNTSDSWIKNSEFAQLVTSDTRVRSAMGFEKIDTFDATVAVKVATLATLDHTSPSISSADSSFDTYTANPVVAAAEERAAALLASSQPMRLPEPAIFPAVSKKLERETLGNIFASDEGYLNPPRI